MVAISGDDSGCESELLIAYPPANLSLHAFYSSREVWILLAQNFVVHFYVEADDQFLSKAKRGGSQIAGRTKN